MTTATSCSPRPGAIAYGSEDGWDDGPPERCRDCNVAVGGNHHAGCVIEQCPTCGGQWFSCDHGPHPGLFAWFADYLDRRRRRRR